MSTELILVEYLFTDGNTRHPVRTQVTCPTGFQPLPPLTRVDQLHMTATLNTNDLQKHTTLKRYIS